MRTGYFDLLECKVNTPKNLKKRLSNILDNQQTGGLLPPGAMTGVNMLIKSPMVRNAVKSAVQNVKTNVTNNSTTMDKGGTVMDKKGKEEAKPEDKKEKKEAKSEDKKGKEEAKPEDKKGKTMNKKEKKAAKKDKKDKKEANEANEEKKEANEEKEKANEEANEKAKQQKEDLNNIAPNSAGPSPDYPKKLQIVPIDPHMTKKLSEKFNVHIDEIKDKIDASSNKIEQQLEYVKEEQRILDEQKEILDNRLEEDHKEDGERSWEMVQSIFAVVKYCADSFMSIVRWILLLIIKFLLAIQPFMWLICAIIGLIILIILIVWAIVGGKFKQTNNEGKDDKTDNDPIESGGKEACGNNYKSGGTEEDWDWNSFIKNPIKYSLERNLSSVNSVLNVPDILNKLNIRNPIYTLRKNFKLLNNDNFKIERTINNNQRDDTISFINYKLIDSNVANKHFSSSMQNENHSISLLKPKNIEWELPHLDYKNTDMDKLPESIKNYKDDNNPDDYSLNDTSKIIFPWKINNNEWVLDCDTIFTNNIKTQLYHEEQPGYCVAKSDNVNRYIPE